MMIDAADDAAAAAAAADDDDDDDDDADAAADDAAAAAAAADADDDKITPSKQTPRNIRSSVLVCGRGAMRHPPSNTAQTPLKKAPLNPYLPNKTRTLAGPVWQVTSDV